MMTMKILYYDDGIYCIDNLLTRNFKIFPNSQKLFFSIVTPADYQPPGFKVFFIRAYCSKMLVACWAVHRMSTYG